MHCPVGASFRLSRFDARLMSKLELERRDKGTAEWKKTSGRRTRWPSLVGVFFGVSQSIGAIFAVSCSPRSLLIDELAGNEANDATTLFPCNVDMRLAVIASLEFAGALTNPQSAAARPILVLVSVAGRKPVRFARLVGGCFPSRHLSALAADQFGSPPTQFKNQLLSRSAFMRMQLAHRQTFIKTTPNSSFLASCVIIISQLAS